MIKIDFTAARLNAAPRIESPAPRTARRATFGNFLDPRLSEQQQPGIKLEPSVTPTPPPQSAGPVLRHRKTFAPHMQYWPTESRASSHSFTNPDYETSSEYSDPSEHRRLRYVAMNSCAIEDDPADVPDPMAVSESTKLKGVYWPGMDIFDSATPEMRRKRNQKKDSSVVQQLELNSLVVEATELVFTPQGSFKRLRRISCSESDEEDEVHIKLESPQPVRRRPVLGNLDVNIPRRTRLNRAPMFSFLPRDNHGSNFGHPASTYTHGDRTAKRKRPAFNVFQDENDDITLPQPTNLTYLTSGFSNQPLPSPMSAFPVYRHIHDPFQFENKENILPPFHQSTYGNLHSHYGPDLHLPVNAYALDHGHYGFHYHSHLYKNNNSYQHHTEDDDDQRTITAPPSPSTN